jgi:thymidylate synthase (FAD)
MTNQIIVQLNPDVPPTGSDLGVVNAARKSFGRRSEWCYLSCPDPDGMPPEIVEEYKRLKPKDKRLLEFLARGMTAGDFDKFWVDLAEVGLEHLIGDTYMGADEEFKKLIWQWRNTPEHDTPFNHSFFSFEIAVPIFTARHLVKHEYLILSEFSRRYIIDEIEFFEPSEWRKAADNVKQGSSSEAITTSCVPDLDGELTSPHFAARDVNYLAVKTYNNMLQAGVAPEQARMILPQSLMTTATWSGTLGAFASMCKLRLAEDTQYETRLVAQGVYEELQKQFPVSAKLLVEGVL